MPNAHLQTLQEIALLETRYRTPDGPLAARIGGLCRSIHDERAGIWLERAVADEPSWQNRWNLTHWLWTLGEFDKGFELSSDILEGWHRQAHPGCENLPLLTSLNNAKGKRVLVSNYGGIGDLLHRCRHLKPLAEAGVDFALHLSLRCRGAADLMRQSAIPLTETAEGFDYLLPDTHIPSLLGVYPAIRAEGYVRADAALVESWRKKLPREFAALCWRAGPEPQGFHPWKRRSTTLARAMAEVTNDLPLVSLQNDLLAVEAHPRLLHHPTDIDDLCAILTLAAEIVTVDTLAANAAGALGCDFTILLPPWPDWRWHHGQMPNPWYRGAKTRWIEDEQFPLQL